MEKEDIDKKISQLGKLATQQAKKDLSAAITTLRKLQELLEQSSFGYSAETWTRLPLYLQKNRQYPEAVVEFHRLIEHPQLQLYRDTFYEKLSLASQREKKHIEALAYSLLSHAYRQLRYLSFIENDKAKMKRVEESLMGSRSYTQAVTLYQEQIRETQERINKDTQLAVWQAIIENSKAKLNLFKRDHVMTLCHKFSYRPSEQEAIAFREALFAELDISLYH